MPSFLELPRSAPAWVRVLLAVQAVYALLYAVLLTGVVEAIGVPIDPDSWWPLGVVASVTGLACAARALLRPKRRVTWALLGVGSLAYAGGFVTWAALYENDASPPYPSIADAGWLLFMIILLLALVVFLRAELPRVERVAWLDALIPACAVSAIASQLLLPIVHPGTDLAADITLLAYPTLDILLIGVTVMGLSVRQWDPGMKWGLLAAGVVGVSTGDILWSYLVASGDHRPGTAADIPYLIPLVTLSWVAWTPTVSQPMRDPDDRLALALPAVAAVSALGLLFYGALTADLIFVSLVLALVAVGAAVLRWSLALRREAQAGVLREVAAELARKAEQQAAVADLGRDAIATANVDELMHRAACVVSAILGAQRVTVLELAPGGTDLVLRADSNPDDTRVDLQALCMSALDTGTPAHLTPQGLCSRIERKGGTWGVIAVVHEGAACFAEDDVSFVQAVANVLGALLARGREEQLEAQLQQSRRLESVGKLAGGVAHDFNNLLAIILNYADFAREAATDEGQRRDLMELSKAAMRGTDLVKQLLLFSRRKRSEAVAVDLAEVVRDTEPMLRSSIGSHIDFRCRTSAELPPTVIDPNEITQVLVNLAVNARDAMPGGGRLTIEAIAAGDAVQLVVADTGAGMTQEVAAKAFDPFFTTKAPGSGTGLGLATVYGIVTEAGGTIELDSGPGRGTRVVIELPVHHGATAELAPAGELPAVEAGNGETILVAEDNHQVRRLACRILRSSGYRVLEARDGEDALKVAALPGPTIDLLLSDVVMPGIGGVALAERLLRERPGLHVLHMSGHTSLPDSAAGPLDLIEKPFTAAELLARVRSRLGEGDLSAV